MIEIFEQSRAKEWNDFIDSSMNGTLFHSWEWLKVIEKNTGSKLYPLVFFDAKDNRPFGVIPLFCMKKYGIKMVFSPPPGSSVMLGPVISAKGYKQHKFELAYLDFQTSIDDFISKFRANYINFITSRGLQDIRPFSWAQYRIHPAYSYRVDISKGEKAVWNNFSRTLREDINRTFSRGIKIFEPPPDESSSVDYVYNSMKERYTQQHINLPMRKIYLQDILQTFGNSSLKIVLAEYEGKLVGATVFTMFKDTVSAWIGAARSSSNHFEVNGCIYQEVITRAIKDGYKWFDIGGANTRQLCNSKAKYGAEVTINFHINKSDLLGSLVEKAYLMKRAGRLRR
jgi:Acetyltransferase (GNAT) domain